MPSTIRTTELKLTRATVFRWLGVLTLFLGACSNATPPSDNLADQSFVTDKPCVAPCWYGLEINLSNKTDVLEKLRLLPFIDASSIHEGTTTWADDRYATYINFACIHPLDENCGAATISKDKLKALWVSVGFNLTLKQVVDKLGEPNYLDYGMFNRDGGCKIVLQWPKRGIVVDTVNERSYELCQMIAESQGVKPDALVRVIYYSAPEGFGKAGDCCPRITWPGFAKP